MNDKLIPVCDCSTLSIDEIEQQIKVRAQLIREMVGTLYPSILMDEIYKLNNIIREYYEHLPKLRSRS